VRVAKLRVTEHLAPVNSRGLIVICFLTLVLNKPLVGLGQGTMVYQNPADIAIFAEFAPYSLDLDGNGIIDFTVIKTGGDFTARGGGRNASVAVPEQLPDLGGFITPLPTGTEIGESLDSPSAWFETYSFDPIPGFPVIVPAYFHACVTAGCVGDFRSTTAFWGVRFDIEGSTHYGWVRLATPVTPPGISINGGTILDWAYNPVPGQPIFAGQVPEPSTWVLLFAAGGHALVAFKLGRRRGKRAKL